MINTKKRRNKSKGNNLQGKREDRSSFSKIQMLHRNYKTKIGHGHLFCKIETLQLPTYVDNTNFVAVLINLFLHKWTTTRMTTNPKGRSITCNSTTFHEDQMIMHNKDSWGIKITQRISVQLSYSLNNPWISKSFSRSFGPVLYHPTTCSLAVKKWWKKRTNLKIILRITTRYLSNGTLNSY